MSTEVKKTASAGALELRELVGFNLFQASYVPAERVAGDSLADMAAHEWRNDPKLRTAHLQKAEALIAILETQGIRLSASNSREVIKTLDWLMTIPAKKAFSLEDVPLAPRT